MKYIVVFKDGHSGGRIKFNNFEYIFVSVTADNEDMAIEKGVCLFYDVCGINPCSMSCSCCGRDYDISVEKDLREATAYKRNCDYTDKGWVERSRFENSDFVSYNNWGKLISLEDYLNNALKSKEIFFIHEVNHKDARFDNYKGIKEDAYDDSLNDIEDDIEDVDWGIDWELDAGRDL